MSAGSKASYVALPRSKQALELYDFYETVSKIYVIASDYNRTVFNVLKLDRPRDATDAQQQRRDATPKGTPDDPPWRDAQDPHSSTDASQHCDDEELTISEDGMNYTYVQLSMLVDTLRAAKTNGFKHLTSGYGILGFIRFTKGYNMIAITRRKKVARIGPHNIYEIEETELHPLWHKKSTLSLRDDESRYRDMFMSFDTKKNFFFSYTYDLTHTLQYNCQRVALQKAQDPNFAAYEDTYTFNSYLLREFQRGLGDCNSKWVLPCIYGHVSQLTLEANFRRVRAILVARRSRHFAGPRFFKRGMSDEGHVANHIEIEQIVYDASSLSLCETVGLFTSFVQMRGSIPVYWKQDFDQRKTLVSRPAIKLGRSDPENTATRLHFAQMFASYGTPLIALDLLKQKEKNRREIDLGTEYMNTINNVNAALPNEHKIQYIAWDFRDTTRVGGEEMAKNVLRSIAEESIEKTGLFQSGPDVREQRGILRTNCVDCLDRTNIAQSTIGQCALQRQLMVMGITNPSHPLVDREVRSAVWEQYIELGDQISLQYGGSRVVGAGVDLGRSDVLQSISRYYSNHFFDSDKQRALNVFLGNYRRKRCPPRTRQDTLAQSMSPQLASAADREPKIGSPVPPPHVPDGDLNDQCSLPLDSLDSTQRPSDPRALGHRLAFQRPVFKIGATVAAELQHGGGWEGAGSAAGAAGRDALAVQCLTPHTGSFEVHSQSFNNGTGLVPGVSFASLPGRSPASEDMSDSKAVSEVACNSVPATMENDSDLPNGLLIEGITIDQNKGGDGTVDDIAHAISLHEAIRAADAHPKAASAKQRSVTPDAGHLSASGAAFSPTTQQQAPDLWHFEDDYYLHVNTSASFVPTPVMLTHRWWEIPLEMHRARLVTLEHRRGAAGPAAPRSSSPPWEVSNASFPLCDSFQDSPPLFASSSHQTHTTHGEGRISVASNSPELLDAATYDALASADPGLAALSAAVRERPAVPSAERADPKEKDKARSTGQPGIAYVRNPARRGGDDALVQHCPAGDIAYWLDYADDAGRRGVQGRQQVPGGALKQTLTLGDGPVTSDPALDSLRASLEGKFTFERPYVCAGQRGVWRGRAVVTARDRVQPVVGSYCTVLSDLKQQIGDPSRAAERHHHRRRRGGAANARRNRDVTSTQNVVYDDYVRTVDALERRTLNEFVGKPYQQYMLSCLGSAHHRRRQVNVAMEGWLMAFHVRELLKAAAARTKDLRLSTGKAEVDGGMQVMMSPIQRPVTPPSALPPAPVKKLRPPPALGERRDNTAMVAPLDLRSSSLAMSGSSGSTPRYRHTDRRMPSPRRPTMTAAEQQQTLTVDKLPQCYKRLDSVEMPAQGLGVRTGSRRAGFGEAGRTSSSLNSSTGSGIGWWKAPVPQADGQYTFDLTDRIDAVTADIQRNPCDGRWRGALSVYANYVACGKKGQVPHKAAQEKEAQRADWYTHNYFNRPRRVQEQMCVREVNVLRYGELYPEEDCGCVVHAQNKAFADHFAKKIPDKMFEERMREVVELLKAGVVRESRMRMVMAASARGKGARMKREGAGDESMNAVHPHDDMAPQVFEKTFLARDIVEYVVTHVPELKLSKRYFAQRRARDLAAVLLDHLRGCGVFHHALPADMAPSFTTPFQIFRFIEDEPLRVLNMQRGPARESSFSDTVQKEPSSPNNPLLLSQTLLRKALNAYRAFPDKDGDDPEVVRSYLASHDFTSFSKYTANLQTVNLSLLATDEQKTTFWVNVYNVLEIHAQFTVGAAFSLHQAVYRSTSCYLVGGFVFSLDVIQHGILRANRRGPSGSLAADGSALHRLFRPFAKDDPRKHLQVKDVDPKVHFALLCLTSADVPNFVNGEAEEVAVGYLKRSVATVITDPMHSPASPGSQRRCFTPTCSPRTSELHHSFGVSLEVPARERSVDGTRSTLADDDLIEDCRPPEKRPYNAWEALLGSTKRAPRKPPINIVLDVGTLDLQLRDIAAKSLQGCVQMHADGDTRTLSIPSVFFDFEEDFGTGHAKVKVLVNLMDYRPLKHFVRNKASFTLKMLPRGHDA
eukprot:TRINITY_DN15823_c0_g1_i1.p1 TRINITY_DN15823_c0_g1~~TRINITY_DN15823_c0_g1_i1.p1  ORF type:complete len:2047 (+),score=718.00 TRINITY_DN15823_c0_g1_i1:130-6270(+)